MPRIYVDFSGILQIEKTAKQFQQEFLILNLILKELSDI